MFLNTHLFTHVLPYVLTLLLPRTFCSLLRHSCSFSALVPYLYNWKSFWYVLFVFLWYLFVSNLKEHSTFWEISPCFLFKSEIRRLMSISCLWVRYRAEIRTLSAQLSINTGGRGKQLAWFCPKLRPDIPVCPGLSRFQAQCPKSQQISVKHENVPVFNIHYQIVPFFTTIKILIRIL